MNTPFTLPSHDYCDARHYYRKQGPFAEALPDSGVLVAGQRAQQETGERLAGALRRTHLLTSSRDAGSHHSDRV